MPRLLVIKPSSLGDIVHGLQVVESLRVQQPAWEVSWVVADRFAELVACCETVDEHFTFERNGGLPAFFRLLGTLRASRYDCVVDLQGLARSALMLMAARGERKIGRRDAREGAPLFYSERFGPRDPSGSHAVSILLDLLPALGAEARLEGQLRFRAKLSEGLLPASQVGHRPIVLFPNSRRAEKEWPHYAELALALAAREDLPPVLLVGQGKAPRIDHPRVHVCFSRTSIEDVLAIIADASLVVCNDSGPMHLAASMGVEVLALFGPTPPARFGPYPLDRPSNHVLEAPAGRLDGLSVEVVGDYIAGLPALASGG